MMIFSGDYFSNPTLIDVELAGRRYEEGQAHAQQSITLKVGSLSILHQFIIAARLKVSTLLANIHWIYGCSNIYNILQE
jgi:hypothetical protein